MSSLSTLPKGDSAWLLRKAVERVMQQVSVLETNIGSSTTGNSANTQIIFNDAGTLRGDPDLTFSTALNKLVVNNIETAAALQVGASATITGDLTVATSALKVTGGKVGIGLVSPNRNLSIFGATNSLIHFTTTATGPLNTDGFTFGVETDSSVTLFNSENTPFNFYVNSTTAMTLNSTGLGVGGSPLASHLIFSQGPVAIAGTAGGTRTSYISNANACSIYYTDGGGSGFFADFGNLIIQPRTSAARSVVIATGSTTPVERLIVDATGNIGIGLTPSAWAATFKPVQIGSGTVSSAFIGQTNSPVARIITNAYFDGANFVKVQNNTAGMYVLSNNQHEWHNAVTGTGTAAFVQAMTLDSGGNLLVGTTSTLAAWATKLVLSTNSGTTKWAVGPYADPNNFIISASGSFGVYLNGTSAVSWTGISDERLKDIIEPISNAVAKVGQLRSVIGKFKSDETNTRRSFLLAQDVQAVLPEAVDASNPDRLGVAYTDVIPLLVAAIKELTAEVNALKKA